MAGTRTSFTWRRLLTSHLQLKKLAWSKQALSMLNPKCDPRAPSASTPKPSPPKANPPPNTIWARTVQQAAPTSWTSTWISTRYCKSLKEGTHLSWEPTLMGESTRKGLWTPLPCWLTTIAWGICWTARPLWTSHRSWTRHSACLATWWTRKKARRKWWGSRKQSTARRTSTASTPKRAGNLTLI